METKFSWAPGGAFLVRSFKTQLADGVGYQGTQVIGWDPRASQIRSWSFDSDGAFGDGVWSRNGDTWTIQSTQTLADGGAASGAYLLTKVDDDTLTLRLVGHEVDGQPLPSRPAIKVVRAK